MIGFERSSDDENYNDIFKRYITTLITDYYRQYPNRSQNLTVFHFGGDSSLLVPYENHCDDLQRVLDIVETSTYEHGKTFIHDFYKDVKELVQNETDISIVQFFTDENMAPMLEEDRSPLVWFLLKSEQREIFLWKIWEDKS